MRSEDEIHADAVEQRAFSNHSQFDYWADSGRGCYDCRHDKPNIELYCPILSAGYLGLWPKEWERKTEKWEYGGKTGELEVVGECSEFEYDDEDGDGEEPQPDPWPAPVAEMEGQSDIFSVFADEIAEQPQRQVVSA